jgi:heme exporter protein A
MLPSPRESAESSPSAIIATDGLVRAFGRRRAVDGVTIGLGAGDCLALFGPNGAGKTTLLRILAGLLAPTSGSCFVDGVSVRDHAAARSRVGLISHATMLYSSLSARENVEFSAKLHGLDDPRGASERALDLMRVRDRADAPVRSLSRGLQQRVSIARAIVHEPRVILCDEPYTGLDEVGAAALTRTLEERRASGAARIVVTHNLSEGLGLATHAAIMQRGKLARIDARSSVDTAAYAASYHELVTADA